MGEGGDELAIKITLDTSQAQAAATEQGRGFDKIARKAGETYKATGRAADKAATDRTTSAGRAATAEVRALDRSGQAFTRHAESGSRGFVKLQEGAGSLIGTMQGFIAAAGGLKLAGDAAKAMLGTMTTANAEAAGWVDKLLKTKNLLRDVAAMTGSKGGSTDAEVQKHLDIRKASGFDDSAAKAFSEGFSGSGESKKGINISEGEFARAKPMIARFAAANSSGDDAKAAGTYGNLAGMLMGFRKENTAESLLGDVSGFNKILSGGVGDNPTLVREAAEQAGALLNEHGTGIVKSSNDLAAMVATASMKSPQQAGSMVGQNVRLLRGFDAKHGAMLTGAGITAKDDMMTAYEKLFVKMGEAERAGTAPDQYLAQQGVEGSEDRQSMATMYQYRSYLARFKEQGRTAPSPAEAAADVEAKFRGDTSLQVNVAQAKLDEAKLHTAMLHQHSEPLRIEAEAALARRDEGTDSPQAAWQDWIRGSIPTVGGALLPPGMTRQGLGHDFRVEQEMHDQLEARGIKVSGRPETTSMFGGYSGDYTSWMTTGAWKTAYAEAASTDALGKMVGGGPKGPKGPAFGPDTVDVIKAINDQTKFLQMAFKGTAPLALPARPSGATR